MITDISGGASAWTQSKEHRRGPEGRWTSRPEGHGTPSHQVAADAGHHAILLVAAGAGFRHLHAPRDRDLKVPAAEIIDVVRARRCGCAKSSSRSSTPALLGCAAKSGRARCRSSDRQREDGLVVDGIPTRSGDQTPRILKGAARLRVTTSGKRDRCHPERPRVMAVARGAAGPARAAEEASFEISLPWSPINTREIERTSRILRLPRDDRRRRIEALEKAGARSTW
jgi:hypothetical protein